MHVPWTIYTWNWSLMIYSTNYDDIRIYSPPNLQCFYLSLCLCSSLIPGQMLSKPWNWERLEPYSYYTINWWNSLLRGSTKAIHLEMHIYIIHDSCATQIREATKASSSVSYVCSLLLSVIRSVYSMSSRIFIYTYIFYRIQNHAVHHRACIERSPLIHIVKE